VLTVCTNSDVLGPPQPARAMMAAKAIQKRLKTHFPGRSWRSKQHNVSQRKARPDQQAGPLLVNNETNRGVSQLLDRELPTHKLTSVIWFIWYRTSRGMRTRTQLFLSVLLGVSLRCLLSVHSGVKLVATRSVCMVCRLLVMAGLVMLGRFPVMLGGVRAVF
jgi:hypothetical protein